MSKHTVEVAMGSPSSGETPDIPHERLVVRPGGVVDVPAAVAEIVEATKISAEVRTLLHATHGAKGVFKVGVHLHLLAKSGSLDLDKSRSDSLHVASAIVEGNSARPYWVLELISIQT